MVQVLSARLRKLRPAEECGGTSEVMARHRKRQGGELNQRMSTMYISMPRWHCETLPGDHDRWRKCLIRADLRSSLEARPQYIRNIQNVCRYGLEATDAYSGVCMNRQSDFLLKFVLGNRTCLIQSTTILAGKLFST